MSGDGIDQVVQSGPQIVQAISDHQRPTLKRRRLIDTDNDGVPGTVRICLLEEAVRVSLKPGMNFAVDGLSVLLAPS